ncbi:MAG TPA: GDSL-type esterase/lipase family protein [Candidatus Krumholzibacteria bacterium]|nr:GDSL-type esterase/lipase family protein [Candidatus Krumholzibacteria bacterium]
MPSNSSSNSSTGRANAILLVVTLVVLIVAAEITLRVVYHPEFLGSVIHYDPVLGWSLEPNASLVSVDSQRGLRYRIDINSLGLRDRDLEIDKRRTARRVLILGDSFVFGVGVNAGERFSDVLGRALPDDVEVINAGVPGWGTDQEMLFYESSLRRLQPDVVVLTFLGQNDVVNNGLRGPLIEVGTKPRFLCDGDRLLLEPPTPPAKLSFSQRAKRTLRKSRLLLFIKRRFDMREYQHHAVEDPRFVTHGYEAHRHLSHWSVYDARGGEAIDEAWCVTERVIDRLAADCREDSAELVVFAFPSQVEVDEPWREEMMKRTGVDPANMDFARPYRRLSSFCAARGIEYHYPIDAFHAAAQKEPLYFDHDAHPNIAANALAAELLRDVVTLSLDHHARR